MKTLIAAILFSTLSLCGFAQAKTDSAKHPKAPQRAKATLPPVSPVYKSVSTVYRCPVCGYTSNKPGECTMDKTALVKVGDYYCPMCYMSSTKAGKCTMCDVDMKQMTATGKVK